MSNPFDSAVPIDPTNPFDTAQPITKQATNSPSNDVGAARYATNSTPKTQTKTPSTWDKATGMLNRVSSLGLLGLTEPAQAVLGAYSHTGLPGAQAAGQTVNNLQSYGNELVSGAPQALGLPTNQKGYDLGGVGEAIRNAGSAVSGAALGEATGLNAVIGSVGKYIPQAASSLGRIASSALSGAVGGTGYGALNAATTPVAPGDTYASHLAQNLRGGAITGGIMSGGLSGLEEGMGHLGGTGAATIAPQIGNVPAPKEGPQDVINAWMKDTNLPSSVYSPNALHEMAEGGNKLAQQYEARLNVATANEFNSNTGKELPINAGNISKTDRDVGAALSPQMGSGVAAHNQAQGEAIHTFLDTTAANHNIAANSRPFDFEGPDSSLDVIPNHLQSSIDNANLTKSNTDNIATSLEGTLAEKSAISKRNYQRVSDEISIARANNSSLPDGPDLSKVMAYDSDGKAVGLIPEILDSPFVKNDEAIGRTVNTWQNKLRDNNLSYEDTKAVQSQIESDIRSMYRNNNPDLMPKIRAYSQLADAVGKAADDYASVAIPDSTAPQDAANYFRENIPAYRNAKEGVVQILKGVDADTTTNKLFGANKSDQLDRIFPLLDSRGQDALRSEYLDRAIKAGAQSDGTYSIQAITDYLNKRDAQLGTLFGGVDAAGNGTNPIKNIVNFARTSPNATLNHTSGVGIPDIISALGKEAGKTAVGATVGSMFGPTGSAVGSLVGARGLLDKGADIAGNMYNGYKFLHPNIEGIAQDVPVKELTAGLPTLSDSSVRPTQPITPGQSTLGMSTPSGGQLNTPSYAPVPIPGNQGIYPAQPMPYNQIKGAISGGNGPAALSMAERPSLSTLGMAPRPATPMPQTSTGRIVPLGPLNPTYSTYPTPSKYNTILGQQSRGWEGMMLDNLARRNRISTEAEYNALKPGQAYEAADGSKGIKPEYIGKPDEKGFYTAEQSAKMNIMNSFGKMEGTDGEAFENLSDVMKRQGYKWDDPETGGKGWVK